MIKLWRNGYARGVILAEGSGKWEPHGVLLCHVLANNPQKTAYERQIWERAVIAGWLDTDREVSTGSWTGPDGITHSTSFTVKGRK